VLSLPTVVSLTAVLVLPVKLYVDELPLPVCTRLILGLANGASAAPTFNVIALPPPVWVSGSDHLDRGGAARVGDLDVHRLRRRPLARTEVPRCAD